MSHQNEGKETLTDSGSNIKMIASLFTEKTELSLFQVLLIVLVLITKGTKFKKDATIKAE